MSGPRTGLIGEHAKALARFRALSLSDEPRRRLRRLMPVQPGRLTVLIGIECSGAYLTTAPRCGETITFPSPA